MDRIACIIGTSTCLKVDTWLSFGTFLSATIFSFFLWRTTREQKNISKAMHDDTKPKLLVVVKREVTEGTITFINQGGSPFLIEEFNCNGYRRDFLTKGVPTREKLLERGGYYKYVDRNMELLDLNFEIGLVDGTREAFNVPMGEKEFRKTVTLQGF